MAARWILQLCHSHSGPFADVARQYAALFQGTPYRVLTVFLTGESSESVRKVCASDEVLFLGFSAHQVRGLKIAAIRKVRSICRQRSFALIIAHRPKPIFVACRATQLPVVGVHHAFGDYRRLGRRLFANSQKKRLALLAVSNAVRDELRQALPSWPAERIETLYNRIDLPAVQAGQISREAARAHLGLPLDAWIVGNVGRLHPDKDQATLIRAFARARLPENSVLAMLGEGRLEAELRQLAGSLGVSQQVRFLGQVANARNFFKAFDLFALSSDHEPFGMVLLEAMAAGVPVVASDCGGAAEVVRQAERRFALGDSAALAALLQPGALQTGSSQENQDERAWLEGAFTDPAGRSRFFGLPMIREWVGEADADR